MPRQPFTFTVVLALGSATLASAQPISTALSRLPIREVTVFKDGHAFVVHRGRVPTAAGGRAVIDGLPTPVLGTFWPYSASREAPLTAVTASRTRVTTDVTALSVRELLEANPGADVEIEDLDGKTIGGRVRGVPQRPVEELKALTTPGVDIVPAKGSLLLLDTAQGVLALPLDRVRAARFRTPPSARVTSDGFRNVLTMTFAWPGDQPGRDVEAGMAYLQKGLRWIPSYRVTIDGAGRARLQLQATLVNELADLDDVTAHLVVGVPTFTFRDAVDPMALQDRLASLGAYFDQNAATSQALSNAILTQVARGSETDALAAAGAGGPRRRDGAPADLGPEVVGSEKEEDLFVFSVRGVTLAKGERMVLPVAETELKYRDVYTLDVPFAPPPELRVTTGDDRQRELARLLGAPRFTHVLRLANAGRQPLTTAPALIVSGERVLGQGLMTYTAPGAECDLALTTAVDLRVTKADRETGRSANALEVNGAFYLRVDLAGSLTVTNRRTEAADIEVRRWMLGHADTATRGGTVEMVNAYEEDTGVTRPAWWGWYGWPGWWGAVNGVGRVTWRTRVEPGQTMPLDYTWHYFWR